MAKKRTGKTESTNVRRNGRLEASDLVTAGLHLLAHGGVEAVRLDHLTRTLGVTKGGFYYYFKSKAELLQAMLAQWRRDATLDVIERLETHESPEERLKQLIDLPATSSDERQSLELSIRLWAKHDSRAAAAVDEVDQHRLAYVASLLRITGVAENRVDATAYLIYAFVLAEHLISAKSAKRSVSSQTLRTLVGEFVQGRKA